MHEGRLNEFKLALLGLFVFPVVYVYIMLKDFFNYFWEKYRRQL